MKPSLELSDTRHPLDRLGEPPYLNYRVSRRAINGAMVLPPVGKQFTKQEAQSLLAWVKGAGFSAWLKGSGLYVIGDDAPDIPDGLEEQRNARWAGKETARQKAKDAVDAARAKEYASLPSIKWIDETLGADFARGGNKLSLARFLDGRGKFDGFSTDAWFRPLVALGFKLNDDGSFHVPTALDFLKKTYKDDACQPQGQDPYPYTPERSHQ